MIRVLACCVLLTACSLDVDYTGTYFPCGENDSCPSDFLCKQGVCIPEEPAPPTCTEAVTSGSRHSCFVRDTDGSVWCWGRNDQGQLGNDTTVDSTIPVQVVGITGATTVVSGDEHSCAIVAGGVQCWGANSEGQLGDGSQVASRKPVSVSGLAGVTAIAAGELHTCAIGGGGAVSCWGFNEAGQLGDGTTTSRLIPGTVPGVTATAIAASDDSTCVVDGGELTCWGFNGEGLFMNGTTDSSTSPTTTAMVSDLIGVAIGGAHLCVVTRTGEVRCAGDNSQGQLGDGTGADSATPVEPLLATKIVSVTAFGASTCAVDEDGGGWCWGNDEGKLALGEGFDFVSYPFKTKYDNVASISLGRDHSCARSRDGAIVCAGFNSFGQLGNGDRLTQPTPLDVDGLSGIEEVAAGGDFSCARTAAGAVSCWGNGSSGQLGDGELHQRATPAPVAIGAATHLAGGDRHACAITTGGGLSCWGLNDSGQLGDGTRSTRGIPLPIAGLTVTAVALGDRHTCAIAGGTLKCWGSNFSGQLGAANNPEPAPIDVVGIVDGPVTSVAAGGGQTCVVDSLKEVQCWGSNSLGQLGINDTMVTSTSTPTKVLLRGGTTPLGGVDEVFARGARTFARAGTKVFGWGYGCDAQLGSSAATCSVTPGAVEVDDITSAVSIVSGYSSTCALKSDGGLLCWGANYFGQIGDGKFDSTNPAPLPTLSNITSVGVGGEHACAARQDGTVACWGFDAAGQLGDGVLDDPGPNFVRFSCTN